MNPDSIAGPIRPSVAVIGTDWCQPTVTDNLDPAGRSQVNLTSAGAYGASVWWSMWAYVTVDEALELAERWLKVANEIGQQEVTA